MLKHYKARFTNKQTFLPNYFILINTITNSLQCCLRKITPLTQHISLWIKNVIERNSPLQLQLFKHTLPHCFCLIVLLLMFVVLGWIVQCFHVYHLYRCKGVFAQLFLLGQLFNAFILIFFLTFTDVWIKRNGEGLYWTIKLCSWKRKTIDNLPLKQTLIWKRNYKLLAQIAYLL